MKLDIPTSVRITTMTQIIPKECYFNCMRTVLNLKEFQTATYVEGWWCSPLPHEHAWIEQKGEILDPTAVKIHATVKEAFPDEDVPFEEGKYFPAVRLKGRRGLLAHIKRHPEDPLPPFFYHDEFRDKMRAVWRKAYIATWGTTPEETMAWLRQPPVVVEED